MIKVIDPPAEEPVSLDEAKLQCKIYGTSEDLLLTTYIVTARMASEHRTGRKLITQTLELALDEFPANEIELEGVPVQTITSIKYLDLNGTEQTVSNTSYALDNYGLKNWVILAQDASWPDTLDSANAVKVQFVAGYGDAAELAAQAAGLKSWILLTIGTLYKNRESTIDAISTASIPDRFYDSLLDPYRTWRM